MLLYCALTMTACSSPPEPITAPVVPPVVPPVVIPVTPKPASVTVTVDSARITRGTYDPDSGLTLRATGVDGTVYELAIAASSLPGPVPMELQPLASVTGNPIGAATILGVRFAPAGARLLTAAQLRITPPAGITAAIGWGFAGDGSDFHLRPTTTASGVVTQEISRFTGAGVGSWSQSAVIAAAPAFQPTGEPGLQQRLALADLGQVQDSSAVEALFESYWQQTVVPLFTVPAPSGRIAPRIVRSGVSAASASSAPCLAAPASLAAYEAATRLYRRSGRTATRGSAGAARDALARRAIDQLSKACAGEEIDLCLSLHELPFIDEMDYQARHLEVAASQLPAPEFFATANAIRTIRERCRSAKLAWSFGFGTRYGGETSIVTVGGERETAKLTLIGKSAMDNVFPLTPTTYTVRKVYEVGFAERDNTDVPLWPLPMPLKFDGFLLLSTGACTFRVTPGAIEGSMVTYADSEWDVERDRDSGVMVRSTIRAFTVGVSPGNDPTTMAFRMCPPYNNSEVFPFANTLALSYLANNRALVDANRYRLFRKDFTDFSGTEIVAKYVASGVTAGSELIFLSHRFVPAP